VHKIERIYKVSQLLSMAIDAHHSFEDKVLNGERDKQWFEWIAEYLIGHGLDVLLENKLTVENLSQFLLQNPVETDLDKIDYTWNEVTARRMVDTQL
jgi:hypothetical protein